MLLVLMDRAGYWTEEEGEYVASASSENEAAAAGDLYGLEMAERALEGGDGNSAGSLCSD